MRRKAETGALLALVVVLLCALMCATACSAPSSPAEDAVSNEAPSEEPSANVAQEGKESVDIAQAAARIEEQRQERLREKENDAAALQAAFDANPSSVEATVYENGVAKRTDLIELTGTVRIKQGLNQSTNQYQDVCMLVLPAEIYVTGTQHGDVHDDTIILDDSYEAYSGKIISVRLSLGLVPTFSIPSSAFSVIHGKDGYVTNVF